MFNDAKLMENREVSIFFHPSDAVHCFRSTKSRMDGFDGSLLTEAWNARDWSRFIGLLVSKAQFLHETSTDNFELRNHLLAFCLRYSNSFPGMIDYIIAMGNVLEGVVQMAVTAIENNLDPVGTVNQALVEKMALEYKIKLGLVLSLDSCLCPATLSDFLLRKLHPVVFRDQKTKAVFVKYDLKSVTTLREVNGHLRAVRNGTAEDLMQASVAVNSYLKNTVEHVK
uniref:Uncharacterized protein n=1 Tax=Ciona savignyi TaxID=51511 RepID=H2YZI6_CIOSA